MTHIMRLAHTHQVMLSAVVSLVILLAALMTPWGLVKSHGSAALEHAAQWTHSDDHGHSHDDDDRVQGGHSHHSHDHVHETANALPVVLHGIETFEPVWLTHATVSTPYPLVKAPERPPKV